MFDISILIDPKDPPGKSVRSQFHLLRERLIDIDRGNVERLRGILTHYHNLLFLVPAYENQPRVIVPEIYVRVVGHFL